MRRNVARVAGFAAALLLAGGTVAAASPGLPEPKKTEPPAPANRPSSAPGPVPPAEMNGIAEPARRAAEPARAIANAILWPFRLVIDLVFLATGTAGALLENEQIVPRAREFFFTRGGQFGVFPTLFLETGLNPNAGVRMIASIDPYAATVRAGYGGPDVNVVESRMRFVASVGFPVIMSLEGFHDRRTGLGFLGLGQTPESDPRNQFRDEPKPGIYRERRERIVAGLGIRPLPDVEVLFSTSLAQRYVDDPADPALGPAMSQAFLPPSTPGAYRATRIAYNEFALRIDSRVSRSGVATGFLLEGYQGGGYGVLDDPTRFVRAGFRAAAFLPLVRRSSILSPKIVVDGIVPLDGAAIPFQEMPRQPTFRGFDNRRDYVSAVASLDYRWYLMRFVAARLFADFARVAPSLSEMNLEHVRWVAGLGLDLHTSTTEVGRIAVAAGKDGLHFLFTFGVPAGFGDRQHRN